MIWLSKKTHTHIFYPKEIKDQESWNELDPKKTIQG